MACGLDEHLLAKKVRMPKAGMMLKRTHSL